MIQSTHTLRNVLGFSVVIWPIKSLRSQYSGKGWVHTRGTDTKIERPTAFLKDNRVGVEEVFKTPGGWEVVYNWDVRLPVDLNWWKHLPSLLPNMFGQKNVNWLAQHLRQNWTFGHWFAWCRHSCDSQCRNTQTLLLQYTSHLSSLTPTEPWRHVICGFAFAWLMCDVINLRHPDLDEAKERLQRLKAVRKEELDSYRMSNNFVNPALLFQRGPIPTIERIPRSWKKRTSRSLPCQSYWVKPLIKQVLCVYSTQFSRTRNVIYNRASVSWGPTCTVTNSGFLCLYHSFTTPKIAPTTTPCGSKHN